MRRNDQPSRPNAMTCSRFSLLKTWLMTTEANFPPWRLCLKPSPYGRFSLDHLWPLLSDHRGSCLIGGLVLRFLSRCRLVRNQSQVSIHTSSFALGWAARGGDAVCGKLVNEIV